MEAELYSPCDEINGLTRDSPQDSQVSNPSNDIGEVTVGNINLTAEYYGDNDVTIVADGSTSLVSYTNSQTREISSNLPYTSTKLVPDGSDLKFNYDVTPKICTIKIRILKLMKTLHFTLLHLLLVIQT